MPGAYSFKPSALPWHRLNILQREIEPVGTLGKSSSVRRTSLQWSYQAC